ncbi:hypothetical protein [Microvirga guangxiensis]|uniref:Uncharacterized protein n=1 Tax=Microvirga guangxiensis TaxID=549386 RepID=A0A1G5DZU2_9HYPH|nr:hypothetical protein [Microvirga guangxiensis]SCY20244.1 hypothetical protein SAMN02927923_00834 [Microvirga guangxiensis]
MNRTLRIIFGLVAISFGAAIGLLTGTLVAAEVFALAFGISAASAEETKYEFYLMLMTFNGAIFGFFGGGFAGLILMRSILGAKASTDDPLR